MEEPMSVVEADPDHDGEDQDREPSSPGDDDDVEHARPRKRTRRACDKCSASRTRCDGECPCRRCQDYGYSCRYNREVKKRGRVPGTIGTSNHGPASQTSSQDKQSNGHFRSPSPLVSPNLATTTHFQGSAVPHHTDAAARPILPSFDSNHSNVGVSNGLGQPISPTSQGAAYAPSPGSYGAPHAHLQLASLLDPTGDSHMLPRSQESPSAVAVVSGSEESAGYPSPANGITSQHQPAAPHHHPRASFGAASVASGRGRPSFSAAAAADGGSAPEQQNHHHRTNSIYRAPSSSSTCHYRCLEPVIPFLRDIIPASVACELLDVYLTEPGSSLFRCASPYILTRIFRKKSVLHPTNPRPMTPALLATILWCAAQTADIVLLHVPGSRSRITNALYELATSLISERDPDRWRRIHGGLRVETEQSQPYMYSSSIPTTTATNEPAGVVDDVLTFILLSIAVSGGDFKSDCFKWWSKAIRLALSLKLNREDERCSATVAPCVNPLCSCRRDPETDSIANMESREERRRVFWMLYCLDRHLSLSFNTALYIPDSYCEVYAPLPEAVWENLDSIPVRDLPTRVIGPPTTVSGTGFLEYFLPLMAILGDIIEIHHRRQHPRLGGLDDSQAVRAVTDQLANCERSIDRLAREIDGGDYLAPSSSSRSIPSIHDLTNGSSIGVLNPAPPLAARAPPPPSHATRGGSRLKLATAYSTLILHVLHVLLHGKWDAISMLDDDDDWITSPRFNSCASHSIAASEAVSSILQSDPELTFMPYLFGIYLLHGSFILLLFADRMPQLGPNQSVEQACETIIRAHEVCVVTLSTEFQKNFRKVLRSTLYSVRGSSPTEWEEHKARRRALSLYRWTKGAKGLGL